MKGNKKSLWHFAVDSHFVDMCDPEYYISRLCIANP